MRGSYVSALLSMLYSPDARLQIRVLQDHGCRTRAADSDVHGVVGVVSTLADEDLLGAIYYTAHERADYTPGCITCHAHGFLKKTNASANTPFHRHIVICYMDGEWRFTEDDLILFCASNQIPLNATTHKVD